MNYQSYAIQTAWLTFAPLCLLIDLFFCIHPLVGQEKVINANQSAVPSSRQSMIVVQGAGGTAEYQTVFRQTCQRIEEAASKSGADFIWIGETTGESSPSDREKVKNAIHERKLGETQLWLILVGHGTFDRKNAKFNLRGPDLAAKDLNLWLDGTKRPVAIVNCASCSAPFINELAVKGRVVVTSTKSGFELNYARFGIHFAEALSNPLADIDKDDQVSLLESFLFASRKVQEFYKSESRLATEHALIDDNGDGKGTPLDFFRGVRVVKKSADDSIPDGPVANQIHLIQSEFEKLINSESRKKRNRLELQLEELRARKSTLSVDEYFAECEKIAVQIAELYQLIEKNQNHDQPAAKPGAEKGKANIPSPGD